MPISLGPPTTNPKWRGWILTLLWLAQLLIAVCLFFISLLMTIFIVGSEARSAIPWYFTATTVLFLVTTTILTVTVLYELTYTCGSLAYLSASRFYRLQLVKSIYFLLLTIFVSVRGTGTVGAANTSVWGGLWRGGMVVGPFWLALVYAVLARRKVERLFGDEEGMVLRMLW
ncbi:hypothetical protein VTL71DRAFT_9260 [Oculimacula yallundae]|uniref:Uncharacterized protein n=1 Tax=Oculimacula yallundae TaxID=86028 RepID=A0ABR4BU94_9HELO